MSQPRLSNEAPKSASVLGSGAGVALAVPETDIEALASVQPAVPLHPAGVTAAGGLTLAKLKLRPSGLWRSSPGITLEVKVRTSPGLALETLKVREVPEPKVASVNVPLRTFWPGPVMENVPLKVWVTNVTPPVTDEEAAPTLVA